MSYYSEPSYIRSNIKVELDLSNYVRTFNIKSVAGVDISKFVEDKLDVDKLKTAPFDLENSTTL